MDLGGSHLPSELLLAIVRELRIVDLKKLRLLCKSLDAVASQFLFRRIYISTQHRDRENLTSISNHDIFSQTVEEIVYDSTYMCRYHPIDGMPLNKAMYKRFFWNYGSRLAGATYTKAAIERGFNRFVVCLQDQEALAEYCGQNLTKRSDSDDLPADFSSLLENPLHHAEVARYLPDDLVRLVQALPKMPNVMSFSVSDCRHTRNDLHYTYSFAENADPEGVPAITFSIQNEGIRGLDAVVLDPRPWPEPFEEDLPMNDHSWYRGFSVLTQAASMTNMKRLGSFDVQSNNEFSGLAHTILHMPPSELHHAMNAFRNLKNLNLKINPKDFNMFRLMFDDAHQWSHTLGSGDIAKVLSAAKHLETLRFELDSCIGGEPSIVAPLSNLLGTGIWSRLNSLSLGHMSLYGDEFLEFFDRHRQTLRSLRLEQVNPLLDKQSTHGKYDSDRHRLGNFFRNMAANTIALIRFDVHLHLEDEAIELTDCIKHSAHGAVEVYEVLQSGGSEQKATPCRHH